MGSSLSSPKNELSDKIESAPEEPEEANTLKRECKVLVFGSTGSGKSTMVTEMEFLCQEGFSVAELQAIRPTIYKNVLDSVQRVIVYMRRVELNCVESSNRELVDKILNYCLEQHSANAFSTEIAEAIYQLSIDPIILKIKDDLELSVTEDSDLIESTAYYFQNVLRIGSPNYCPNAMDKLKATEGSTRQITINMGTLRLNIVDIGYNRSERKKWIQCFECVTSIIFCATLSDYDYVLLGEKTKTRMVESFTLFESVVNSRWFARTSIILLLNKCDMFKKKLSKVPLEQYFPEYTGGSDINKAAKYILWKFMVYNRARLSVYPHITQELDKSVFRLIFAAVKETILQNALLDSKILP